MDCANNAAEYVALGYEVEPLYAASPALSMVGLREKVARVLMLYDLDSDGDWPAEKVEQAFEYANANHSGDCTKQPWTCMRCVVDDVYKQTDAILALLAREGVGG